MLAVYSCKLELPAPLFLDFVKSMAKTLAMMQGVARKQLMALTWKGSLPLSAT